MLKNWIDAYLAGDVTFMPRSENTFKYHQENQKTTVQKLTGNSFKDFMADKTIDRMVFLTHEECASCQQLVPSYEQLATVATEKKEVIKFGIMDCKHNDPPSDIEVHSYPRIVFYQEGSNHPWNVQPSEMFTIVKEILQEKAGQKIEWHKTDKDEL